MFGDAIASENDDFPEAVDSIQCLSLAHLSSLFQLLPAGGRVSAFLSLLFCSQATAPTFAVYGDKPRVQSWTGVLVEMGNYQLVFTGLDLIERVQGQSSFSLLHITIN